MIIIGSITLLLTIVSGILFFTLSSLEQYIPNYITGLGSFTGTILGVIAGVAITYTVQHIGEKNKTKQLISNFKKELNINKSMIENWLTELTTYRNSVNGDSLANYYGYYQLSSFLGVVANQIHASGVIYTVLSEEEFKNIQIVYNELTLASEQFLNNEINNFKIQFKTIEHKEWVKNNKPAVVDHINFWEKKFKEHIQTINKTVEKLNNYK